MNKISTKVGQEVFLKDIGGSFCSHPGRKLPKRFNYYKITQKIPFINKIYKIIGTQTLNYNSDLERQKCIIMVDETEGIAYWTTVEKKFLHTLVFLNNKK